jgi:hypothetical protein
MAEIRPPRSSRPAPRQVDHRVEVPFPRRPCRRRQAGADPLVALDDPLDGLMGGAADRGRTSIAAHVSVGGNRVLSFPCVLQWSSLRGDGVLVCTATVTTVDLTSLVRHEETMVGTSTGQTGDSDSDSDLATNGDFSWPRTCVRAARGLQPWGMSPFLPPRRLWSSASS